MKKFQNRITVDSISRCESQIMTYHDLDGKVKICVQPVTF